MNWLMLTEAGFEISLATLMTSKAILPWEIDAKWYWLALGGTYSLRSILLYKIHMLPISEAILPLPRPALWKLTTGRHWDHDTLPQDVAQQIITLNNNQATSLVQSLITKTEGRPTISQWFNLHDTLSTIDIVRHNHLDRALEQTIQYHETLFAAGRIIEYIPYLH